MKPLVIFAIFVLVLGAIGLGVYVAIKKMCKYDVFGSCQNGSQLANLLTGPAFCPKTSSQTCSNGGAGSGGTTGTSGGNGGSGDVLNNCVHGTVMPNGCHCLYGWVGAKCDQRDCKRGTNVDNVCQCPENFGGAVCDTPICQNGGTVNGDGCICARNFYGTYCDKKCVNGTFTNGVCMCKTGWAGNTCEQKTCLNGSTMDSSGNCVCPKGFIGEMCENTICAVGQTQNCVQHPLKAKGMYLSTNDCFGNNNVSVNLFDYPNVSGKIFNLCPEPTNAITRTLPGPSIKWGTDKNSCNYLAGSGPGFGGTNEGIHCPVNLTQTTAKNDMDLVFVSDGGRLCTVSGYGPIGVVDGNDCKMLGGMYNVLNGEGKGDCHFQYCRVDGLRSV